MSKKKNKKKDKLKRCPFCNGKFEIHTLSSESGLKFWLSHKNIIKARDNRCPLVISYYFDSEQDCIDTWNHRV